MKKDSLAPVINFAAVDFWYHNRAHSEIQIATRLSRHTKVLFVNSIGMRAPLPGRSTKSGFRILRKIKSLFRGLRKPLKEFPNFYVFTPLVIPAYSTPWLRTINYALIYLQVRIVMVFLRITNPIVIETIPTANDIARRLHPRCEIINRVDKMSAFGEADQEYIASCERAQISRAQRTYYTSQLLLEDEYDIHNGKGLFLDHGVDIELFSRDDNDRPSELFVEGKIIGFFGGLDDYVIDFDLLEKIADRFDKDTLVLIGEATCDISSFTSKKNVKHLGFRPIEEVAHLGAFFDVAILPRRNDEWTKYTNPIKIKEYLALGLNIVTMDIPEVRIYKDILSIAHGHDEFLTCIEKALGESLSDDDRKVRRSRIIRDTWDARCDYVISDMKELTQCVE